MAAIKDVCIELQPPGWTCQDALPAHPCDPHEQAGQPSVNQPAICYSIYSQLNTRGRRGLARYASSCLLGRLFSRILWCKKYYQSLPTGRLKEHPKAKDLAVHNVDKAFAVAWLDSNTLLWGTKCNRLLMHHLDTGHVTDIPLEAVPPHIKRPAERDNQYGRCGIHSLAINPSRTLLASGGHHPNDATVMSIFDHHLKPVKTYLGHQDWIFSLAWLSDLHFASGGRDGMLKLWKVNTSSPGLYTRTRAMSTLLVSKQGKVRDMSYCSMTRSLVALDPCGRVHDVDPYTWQVSHTWTLPETDQLVCMASSYNLVAVGGESYLLILDKRVPTCAAAPHVATKIVPHGDREGLRSVRFNANIISCGGAYGGLSFWDMCSGCWVENGYLATGPCLGPPGSPSQTNLEETLRDQGRDYMQHGAIYCQEWDASGNRMAVGGGPLAIGLKGLYAAVWS